MRIIKLLPLLLFSGLLLSFAPHKTSYTYGLNEYTNYPVDINKTFTINLPFTSKEAMTVTFSYVVKNTSGTTVYTKNEVRVDVIANALVPIQYVAPVGLTTIGVNTLILTFKSITLNHTRYHYSQFWGYTPNEVVILNNYTSARASMGKEAVYKYNGFQAQTEKVTTTILLEQNIKPNLFMPHDLYLNLSDLYFFVNQTYLSSFYTTARIYFDDVTLFPRMPKSGGKPYINLMATQTERLISFKVNTMLYFEPGTYLMSTIRYTNTKTTNKLFFPKSHLGSIDKTKCRLEIKQFGFNKFTIIYDFEIEIGQVFFGPGGYHEVMINRY